MEQLWWCGSNNAWASRKAHQSPRLTGIRTICSYGTHPATCKPRSGAAAMNSRNATDFGPRGAAKFWVRIVDGLMNLRWERSGHLVRPRPH
eukprot:scaffold15571_cov114-Skeletonema_marinoi.AAC.1